MTKLNRKEEYIVYTVLIENDNTAKVTERQRIMQCSKLVDVLQIVVPKVYNDLDISQCVAKLEYLTPINHNHGFIELEVSDPEYKTDFILYKMPIDINLTSEVGDLEFSLTFIKVEMTEDGIVKTPVRKTDVFIMPVIPIANWFSVPDAALNALDQKIIANQEAIKAMADIQTTLSADKLDDIVLDSDGKVIYGTSGGVKKGVGINIEDLGNAIADNTSDGMVLVNTYNEEGNG